MDALRTYMWVGFALFLVVMMLLGYVSARKTKNVSDFAIGGGNLGPYVLGLSFAATYFSAATFLGYPGWSHEWGYSNLWLFLAMMAGGPIGVLMVAKKARKLNTTQKSLSLPDWLGDFYNSDFLRVGTGLILLFNLFYIAAQFAAGARIFEYMLGLSYTTGLVIIAVIVVIYVFAGGAFADVYTDAVQAVLMAIAGTAVFVSGIIIFWDGSITATFSGITSNLASQDGNLTRVFNPDSTYFYSMIAVSGAVIIQWAFASAPQLFNKVLGLKNERDMGKMILTYVVTTALCLVVFFGGIYSRMGLGDQVSASDLALMEYVVWAAPAIVAAFMGVVILAAAMSTTDGLFVVLSTVFANDIYRKVLVKRGIIKADEEKVNRISLWISRVAVVAVGLAAFLIVLQPPQYMGDVMWIGISGVAAGTMGPILYAVFGKKRASPRAAEISMVVGLVSYFVIYFGGIEPSTMAAGAWSTLIGIGTMLLLVKLLKSPPAQTLEEREEEQTDYHSYEARDTMVRSE
ncbi:sodium:solute symporter family protein [Alteribacillus iranensis]|uniref:Sodium/proline symporter n=1 Tax=Alteribacillus iranensis TaxID=930128 RepID=A0A1I2BBA6_9BACI|nr:sodium:pantothenate symporter [Alteribacillus iranensis]SFE53441.1 sodium/proline symporter [Alteribacillus iranensis]